MKYFAALLMVCFLASCADPIKQEEVSEPEKVEQQSRPEHWATKIKEEGLPNFHKVDDRLYRGAQPTEEGMKKLAEMGIKTVINLRTFHSDRDEIGKTPLNYEHITMQAWDPEEKEVIEFLQIVTDPSKQPVFVHCQHGADRTGVMCAIYRVAVSGWEKEEALTEMKDGGYNFHLIWKNIETFFSELDIDKMKESAGMKPAA